MDRKVRRGWWLPFLPFAFFALVWLGGVSILVWFAVEVIQFIRRH